MKHVEVERKFDIRPGAAVPSLEGIARFGPAREHRMRAIYYDTRHLLLVRNGAVLRRREGGADAGWHLKLPVTGDVRLEVTAPLTGGPGHLAVPATLRAEVAGFLEELWPDGAPAALLPVAVLETLRVETTLLDDEGTPIAELADDTVTARPGGETWRELEVELADARQPLLERIDEVFAAQGIKASRAPSKLSRALGDRPARMETGERFPPKATAAEVILDHIAEQVAVIVGREMDVRADHSDGVHKTRVATRRLRSTLRTFRRLFHRDETDWLRDELRWVAGVLGQPRDAEVMKARLADALAELADGEVVGPVEARVRAELDARHARAHAALVEVLDGDRYRELVDRLLGLLADPPWRGRAGRRGTKLLPPMAGKAIRRVRVVWDASRRAEGAERMHLLHETRKRAKAARYAFEALDGVVENADGAAAAWEEVTEELGNLQDAQVAGLWLRELAHAAEAGGEPSRTYGALLEREKRAAERQVGAGEQAVVDAFRLTAGFTSERGPEH